MSKPNVDTAIIEMVETTPGQLVVKADVTPHRAVETQLGVGVTLMERLERQVGQLDRASHDVPSALINDLSKLGKMITGASAEWRALNSSLQDEVASLTREDQFALFVNWCQSLPFHDFGQLLRQLNDMHDRLMNRRGSL